LKKIIILFLCLIILLISPSCVSSKNLQPTSTVKKPIILPTIIPTKNPSQNSNDNSDGNANIKDYHNDDLFDFLFDVPDSYRILDEESYADITMDDGERYLWLVMINEEMKEGGIGSLGYNIVIYPKISEASTKYDKNFNNYKKDENYVLISEKTIFEYYPIALFLEQVEGEDVVIVKIISRIRFIYFETFGITTIYPSTNYENKLLLFVELINKLHFRAMEELADF